MELERYYYVFNSEYIKEMWIAMYLFTVLAATSLRVIIMLNICICFTI